ncbi:hypothetical protein [Streptomyces chattanoogensis]|uniref:hypothetical protein n=1 Tax=Streptomyces chattanoogensis TaxID=66876 RepID=UPI003682F676
MTAVALLAAPLTACGSSESSAADGKSTSPQSDKPAAADDDQQVSKAAQAYMKAWMIDPADVKAMCQLTTKAARPNFDDDGGTVGGCVTERKDLAERSPEPERAALKFTITDVQDVNASRKHPAGKGVLATGQRDGEKPFRYALRLIKEDGQWRIEQRESVDSKYNHTADPVADILWSMG